MSDISRNAYRNVLWTPNGYSLRNDLRSEVRSPWSKVSWCGWRWLESCLPRSTVWRSARPWNRSSRRASNRKLAKCLARNGKFRRRRHDRVAAVDHVQKAGGLEGQETPPKRPLSITLEPNLALHAEPYRY